MTKLQILSKEEVKNFSLPLKFSKEEREKYFSIDSEIEVLINKIDDFSNKVCYILLYGYFKATGKFMTSDKFYDDDIEYVVNLLGNSKERIQLKKYMKNSFWRHQKIIVNILGYTLFGDLKKDFLDDEIGSLIVKQVRPRQVFLKLVEFLKSRKIEIPSYHTIAGLVTNRFNLYEKELFSKLENLLDCENKELLDELIEFSESIKINKDQGNQGKAAIFSSYRLTLLKKVNHSTKPSKVRESINDFIIIKALYKQISPVIDKLNLPVEAIKYYAIWVTKARISQLSQFSNLYKRYLCLISFITYQYYFRQDLFVDTLLACVQSTKNTIKRLEKEQYFENKKDRSKVIEQISQSNKFLKTVIIELKAVIKSESLSSDEKIERVKKLLQTNKLLESEDNNLLDKLSSVIEDQATEIENKNYYDLLKKRSIKLQNRVKGIIKILEFNDKISDNKIINAINYYKFRGNNIDKNAPTDFLSNEERGALYDNLGKFRTPLYKALLFVHIADALKSGELSLKYSYRYLSIEEYLITKEVWETKKDELIKKAGLEEFTDFNEVMKILKSTIHQQYQTTNNNILNKNNQHIKFNKDEKAIAITLKVEKADNRSMSELFPSEPYPILQILSDVNKVTNFVSCFEHYNVKHAKQKPKDEIFFGGIMGYGFDLGTNRIAKISKGLNGNTLENTANWYFTLDNLYAANNVLAEQIDKLDLSDRMVKQKDKLHTASDGQKFNIAVDSLNANYSFKYFGKEKGISIYSFSDEKSRLFYSNAFSSSEREAAYVIDGLLHNDEVKSDIHSTDTHGFTETIFATTHMLGIFFAPRIKNLKKQKLYSFKNYKIKDYKDKNYKILPSDYLDEKLMEEKWDDNLRFIVTIKLKYSTASQIFKRLSSYAKQNPLYKALKEFGRITKTIFILKYYDDLNLRQEIEKQLNLVELSHKFAKAIFFGNNQEFQVESKEEQEIIVNCRRLIQNAIILWNYLYLSKLLMECGDREKRQEMLKIIQSGSIITWRHANLHGEYDFTKTGLSGEEFDIEKIMRFDVGM